VAAAGSYLGIAKHERMSTFPVGKVDFAIEREGVPLPIEVKAAENLQAKSLKVARDRFGIERCMRTSLSGYRDEGWLTNVSLWAIEPLEESLRPGAVEA
jgi:hypothetical protein